VNLKGTFNTLRQAARRLRTGGRIVNFSTSVVGLRLETHGVYVATTAAVEAMTPVLAKELRGRSITVNAIAPGPTATALFLDGKPPEIVDRIAKLIYSGPSTGHVTLQIRSRVRALWVTRPAAICGSGTSKSSCPRSKPS
jgi:NAD(P)-dependent dehydrogenase (short-subunit alcohol dehydrogenase family)